MYGFLEEILLGYVLENFRGKERAGRNENKGNKENQGFKFCSVSAGTVGIFRSIPKIGTEHVMKNSGLCTALFRSESPEFSESGRYTYSDRNRGINFSVLKFICLFCIFLY